MSRTRAWRCCAAAGVAAFICSRGFGRIPGLIACGPSGGLGPILAFEFVRSPAEVTALFGDAPCRSTLVRARTVGLLLDCFAFVPAYVVFLSLAAKAAAPARAGVVLMTVLVTAGLADAVEGLLLYRILTDLPGGSALIGALWWPVHIKFALLGLGTLGIGVLLATGRKPLAVLGGAIISVGALRASYGLAADLPGMMAGFTIAWVTILPCAVPACLRPSLFSAP